MKYIFLKQLFIVIKQKPFKSYYLQKYKIRRGQIGPPFYRSRSGSDRVWRFITGLALDKVPYRGHIFYDRGPIDAPPKFLHGYLSKKDRMKSELTQYRRFCLLFLFPHPNGISCAVIRELFLCYDTIVLFDYY